MKFIGNQLERYFDKYHGHKSYALVIYENVITNDWIEVWKFAPKANDDLIQKPRFQVRSDESLYVKADSGRIFGLKRDKFNKIMIWEDKVV